MNLLTVADRAYAEPGETKKKTRTLDEPPPTWPGWALVLDTETTTDPTQRLLFGSYTRALLAGGRYVKAESGLFYADDLPERDADGFTQLQRYADARGLRLRSQRDFIKNVFLPVGYHLRGLIVGFNLPFDISRIARGVGPARGHMAGGFSFVLDGDERGENRYAPRVRINTLDSKRSFITLSKPHNTSKWQLIPEGSADGKPRSGYVFQGRFLDLRTLAFVLTDRSHSLESACKAFVVTSGKGQAAQHGVITPDYISYNVQDVTATLNLLNALNTEFDRHPIVNAGLVVDVFAGFVLDAFAGVQVMVSSCRGVGSPVCWRWRSR